MLAFGDAGLGYTAVQQAYVGQLYGDSTCGQAALYGLGTGIPAVNVNNNKELVILATRVATGPTIRHWSTNRVLPGCRRARWRRSAGGCVAGHAR